MEQDVDAYVRRIPRLDMIDLNAQYIWESPLQMQMRRQKEKENKDNDIQRTSTCSC